MKNNLGLPKIDSMRDNYLMKILGFKIKGIKPTICLLARRLSIKSGSLSEMVRKCINS